MSRDEQRIARELEQESLRNEKERTRCRACKEKLTKVFKVQRSSEGVMYSNGTSMMVCTTKECWNHVNLSSMPSWVRQGDVPTMEKDIRQYSRSRNITSDRA